MSRFFDTACKRRRVEGAISKLYNNNGLRRKFASAGRERVLRQFSYDKMNALYYDMFKSQHEKSKDKNGRYGGKLRLLIDLDNTVVDWDKEFIARFSKRDILSNEKILNIVQNRSSYEIEKNFDENVQATVLDVVAEPTLHASLEPYPGAIEALKEMAMIQTLM